jgi:hypothetical protein
VILKKFALPCIAGVILVAAGCAQPTSGVKPVSAEHWELSGPEGNDEMVVASINASDHDNRLQVYCHLGDKALVVMLLPRELAGDDKDQRLTLGFDGGGPQPQFWRAQMYKGRFYDFSLGSDEPGFDAVIDGLRRHRSVETVITTAGKEARRDTFTLNGASDAVDRVVAACK